jgi:4-hydroxythreonine-4-phosphate dehydrogenase
MAHRPTIAITMGDPAGVGPEVALQLLNNEAVCRDICPVVFGDKDVLAACARHLKTPLVADVISESDWDSAWSGIHKPTILHLPGLQIDTLRPGVVSADTGLAGYRYVIKSIDAALANQVSGVATGPLNKEALRAAGIPYPGHTEIFADKTHAPRSCMFQYSDEVRASFVTVHVGYSEVPSLLSIDRIVDVIELTADAMQRIRGTQPRLCVLGLNPHAGEHGLFGNQEEERIIAPAVALARSRGFDVEGPIPPDTAFLPAKRRSMGAFICMYHDQGHIPLKALAFDTAVNTTLGLPIIRTSVDHGTACDIAWQGVAKGSSLVEAVRLAAKLAMPNESPTDA